MAQLHLYTNASAGLKDGTEVSDSRTFLTPVDVTVNAGSNETKIVAVGLRANENIKCTDVTITTDIYDENTNSYTGNTDSMINFSLAETGLDASEVLQLDTVTDTNTIIYIVISTSSLQNPGVNKNTSVRINYTAESVT